MRKWMFACAVVTVASFLADPVSAQTVQSSGTVIESSVPQTRGGIFSRLRNRRSTPTTVSQPMTTTTTTTAKAMPGTSSTPSKVQQAQAVEPAPLTTTPMTTATTPTVETRQGLLSRLRLRR